jgi:hypothetical protein
MAKEKQTTSQRRQGGLDAAESAKSHQQYQTRHQEVADRARETALEIQHRQNPDFEQAAQRFAKEAAEVHAATLRFVNTEARTGLNLAHLAADSRDAKKRARNRRHAREAYDSALKRLGAVSKSEELEAVHQKMRKLRDLLKSLGEEL